MTDPVKRIFGKRVLGGAVSVLVLTFVMNVIFWYSMSRNIHNLSDAVSPSLVPLIIDSFKNAKGNVRMAAEAVVNALTQSQITDLEEDAKLWMGSFPIQDQSRTAFGVKGGTNIATDTVESMFWQQLESGPLVMPSEIVSLRNDLTIHLNNIPPGDKCGWIKEQLDRISGQQAAMDRLAGGGGAPVAFLGKTYGANYVVSALIFAAQMSGCGIGPVLPGGE